jgi:probable phosphoglycerate mutase
VPLTVLFLIRHAAPAPGADEADDPGLSPTGLLQAQALGLRLRDAGLESVLHGPARRTAETAAALTAALPGVAVRPDELLRDRTPVPSPGAAADLVPERYLSWFDTVPAAERDEGGAGLDEAVEHFSAVGDQDRRLALVTHSFVVAWFVRRALGAPWGR